jgi:hypothetical protein
VARIPAGAAARAAAVRPSLRQEQLHFYVAGLAWVIAVNPKP